jgi:ferritin-like metal-binding protein YciE
MTVMIPAKTKTGVADPGHYLFTSKTYIMKQNGKNKTQPKQRAATSRTKKVTNQHNGKSNGRSNDRGNGSKESLLEKLFTDQLKDMYYAEQQLLKAIPKMARACTTEELEDAFNEHLQQTERQVKRLEKVFQMIGKKPEGKKCEAMDGLIKEAESLVKDTKEGTMTRDAGLIIAAQKIEHYEIATYGSLVQLAITMCLYRASDILDKTLVEEGNTDGTLTHIAETYINVAAEQEGPYSWERRSEEEEEEEEETSAAPMAYSM